jgi:glycerol-3-phosphate dehydrogenase (NAD(P)+)
MKISVFGAGSWGTALVSILSINHKINWWIRREKLATQIKNKRRNTKYLAGCKLKLINVFITTDLDFCIKDSDFLIVAIPSEFVFNVFNSKGKLLNNKTIFSAIKGVVPEKLISPHNYFLSLNNNISYGVISGPCHAEEIALCKQSYLTIASEMKTNIYQIKKTFSTSFLKISGSDDIFGVEYAAILKNVYAIAVGIAVGLGYGDNFLSVLITASANEMKQILYFLDPKERTISKSEYLGDLLVTCYSPYSRNRKLGTQIGKGFSVESALEKTPMIAEGYHSSKSIIKILRKNYKLKNSPIVYSTYKILYNDKDPKQQIKRLCHLIG